MVHEWMGAGGVCGSWGSAIVEIRHFYLKPLLLKIPAAQRWTFAVAYLPGHNIEALFYVLNIFGNIWVSHTHFHICWARVMIHVVGHHGRLNANITI